MENKDRELSNDNNRSSKANECNRIVDILTMDFGEVSHRHKIKMNRIFRELVGGKFIPFPEVDTWVERIRSSIVVLFKRR